MIDKEPFNPVELIRLSGGRPRADGEGIAFRIETAAGNADIACSLKDVGDIMSYLGHVAKANGQKQRNDSRCPQLMV